MTQLPVEVIEDTSYPAVCGVVVISGGDNDDDDVDAFMLWQARPSINSLVLLQTTIDRPGRTTGQ